VIDISRMVDECSAFVSEDTSAKLWYANDILHIEFEWLGYPKRYKLARLYSREMVENYRGDLTECIFEDFKRQVGSDCDV
jgi:hypothetical protein